MNKQNEVTAYIHIPFCTFKCFYCDFNTYAGLESLIPTYIESVKKEILRWGQTIQNSNIEKGNIELKSIFIGGGTPSLLNDKQLGEVLETLNYVFSIPSTSEITIEANPESIEEEKFRNFKTAGINRVSIGGQSTNDSELQMLGRLHNSKRLTEAYEEIKASGIESINIDFMYNLPGQSLSTWETTLNDAIELDPDHLSLYGLTIEERTPFYNSIKNGTLPDLDDDLAADMYELAEYILPDKGYDQYEISNWAKPNKSSIHNIHYWENGDFIGIGPGAHSHIGKNRFSNILQPREYIKALERLNQTPALFQDIFQVNTHSFKEKVSKIAPISDVSEHTQFTEAQEALILELRLNKGVNLNEFEEKYGINATDRFNTAIAESNRYGLIENNGSSLKLTPKGRLLSNEVFVRIMGIDN
jgi:oxygen-independent coproporphyrinogen-3 oxidase